MNEEWRDIPGYLGLYQVSNTGKVRSLPRHIPVTRRSKSSSIEKYSLSRSSKELKPYSVSKEGRVKFHLHRRLSPGTGSHKQSDQYVYADELVASVFSLDLSRV